MGNEANGIRRFSLARFASALHDDDGQKGVIMKRRCLPLSASLLFFLPQAALAGMPSVTPVLTELGRMRLQNLSFFFVGFLFSAFLIQRLWNYLGRDFTILPRLSYCKALGLTTLWGLLFILVLTMISGARELMTPGAWEKKGATYKLANAEVPSAAEKDRMRRDQIERLRDALWDYARKNDWKFPAASTDPAIPASLWQVPDLSGMNYLYVGGAVAKEGRPLAFEPELFGEYRYVVLSDGQVRRMTGEQLRQALPAESKP